VGIGSILSNKLRRPPRPRNRYGGRFSTPPAGGYYIQTCVSLKRTDAGAADQEQKERDLISHTPLRAFEGACTLLLSFLIFERTSGGGRG